MKIKPHINKEKFKMYRENVKNNKQFQEYTKDNTPQYRSRRITRLTSFCYCHDKKLEELLAETEVEKVLELIKTFEDYKNKHDYSPEGIKTEIKTIRGIYRFIGVDLPRKNHPINLDYTNDIKKSNSYKTFTKQKTRAESTLRRYRITLTQYCDYHQKRIDELIEEADKEEDARIRENKRKIKNRLLEYRSYLRENNYAPKTITSRLNNIKTFYRANNITIPYIEADTNQYDRQLRYDEIPTKQHIKRALETTSNIKNRAIILFMATSGSATKETVNITIKQYMEGTKECHDETTDIERALKKMDANTEYIPVIPMIRGKNKFEYYTAITPEANQYIINYLKTRQNLTLEDKLFDVNKDQIKYMFSTINDKNKWGWVKDGRQRLFTSHQLRRYHYNTIKDIRFANTIEGRKFSKTQEAYFTRNPKDIREEYKQYLEKLTIYEKYQIKVIKGEEYEEISKVLEEKDKRIEELEEALQTQMKKFEDRLNQVEKGLPHLKNANPSKSEMLKPETLSIRLNLESYINSCLELEDESLSKLDKKIQSLTEKEIQALLEISFDIAINDEKFKNTVEMKPIIEKALIRMTNNPEMIEEVIQFYDERKLNHEKLRKYHKILFNKLVELDLWDKEEIEIHCDNIAINFNENVDNVLIEDITEEYVLADIEKYIY